MIRYSGAVTNPHSTSRVPLLQLGYALHVKQWVETNQIIAVVPLGSEPLQLIQQTIQFGTGISPNVSLSTFQCECGDYHCRLTALQPIGTNEVLSSYLKSDKTTLLVQFDGSCHADKETGGAGAALLELQREGLTLLKWRAVALPSCPDNIFAEAVSVKKWYTEATQLTRPIYKGISSPSLST